MMTEIKCTCCGKPLTGGVDTFGEHFAPMCWDCESCLLWDELPSPRRWIPNLPVEMEQAIDEAGRRWLNDNGE